MHPIILISGTVLIVFGVLGVVSHDKVRNGIDDVVSRFLPENSRVREAMISVLLGAMMLWQGAAVS
jgi:hypothetical protein